MKFRTRAIHVGQRPDPVTGAVTVPVYQTSTYQQRGIGQPRDFEYSRTGNPTRAALEQALSSLEGGFGGLAFASGVAATTAVLQLLRPGDHLVAGSDIYGGTYRLLEQVYRPWGLSIDYAEITDPSAVAAAIRPETRMLWLETPTNPLLDIGDIAALASLARKNRARLVVDNTFASPYLQRPLELGADLVVHSTTKYLGGHSDVIGGAVISASAETFEAIKFYQNTAGAVPAPWDCWLILRGLKTLALRMREHQRNAQYLAQTLQSHPAVEKVFYPGLPDHPGQPLASRQMKGYGGMISLRLKGGFAAVERLVARLELFILGESLGGVESLICHPATMTHAALPSAERLRRGIGDNLIRLSIGIEDRDDLLDDLHNGLEAAQAGK